MGVSENVVYPIVPNGFADHYPVFKWPFICYFIGNMNPTFSGPKPNVATPSQVIWGIRSARSTPVRLMGQGCVFFFKKFMGQLPVMSTPD